ncbi:restriction endonuclease family protein [Lyngbya aestuarii BL J]|uniref:Restriction endonuclease family protein n=1 Tax=Lyngbya aestuarii BL J TaxID=1348334 RepID=U7QPT2_9CYAN|nr:Uma2 family endonuclease [Lyngbya aestuarii]ERT09974.1 restriction endonuclease family protein [Lyngbya aestuarii BL J]
MSVQQLKRRFTISEYHQMAEVGILTPSDRVELINGEIIEMSPIGKRHAACVNRLNQLFSQSLGDRILISVQNPILLNNLSEPQPDIALLQPRSDFYASGHPQASDIFLIVEVADSSINYDQEVKIPLYSASGITEVWLIDLNQNILQVYQQPTPNNYQIIQQFQPENSLSSLAFPENNFRVDQMIL